MDRQPRERELNIGFSSFKNTGVLDFISTSRSIGLDYNRQVWDRMSRRGGVEGALGVLLSSIPPFIQKPLFQAGYAS